MKLSLIGRLLWRFYQKYYFHVLFCLFTFSVSIAEGIHLIPFRTQQLSPLAAMVMQSLCESSAAPVLCPFKGKPLSGHFFCLEVLPGCGLEVLPGCGLEVLPGCGLEVLPGCGLEVLPGCSLEVLSACCQVLRGQLLADFKRPLVKAYGKREERPMENEERPLKEEGLWKAKRGP